MHSLRETGAVPGETQDGVPTMNEGVRSGQGFVWDLPTRVFHWALAGSFLGAYLLAEDDGSRTFHVMFGYTVAGLLVFRLLWGFLGSRHSRFSDFAFGPGAALRYLRDLARGQARDYEGHNPAGSWAIYALLALAAATAATGLLNYNGVGGEAFEETHEVLANAWFVMVFVHVAGVIVGSLAHRRNLVAGMITGWRTSRRAASSRTAQGAIGGSGDARPGWLLGGALLATVVGFWTWSVKTGGGDLLAGARSAQGASEAGELLSAEYEHEDDD